MNYKIWVSVLTGLTAAAIAVCMSAELLSPVSAAAYTETASVEEFVPEIVSQAAEELVFEQATAAVSAWSIRQAEEAAIAADLAQLRDAPEYIMPIGELLEIQQQILEEAAAKTWRSPMVRDTYISSPFGMRLHPVYGYYKMHNGVDLNSEYGEHIVAARGGVVISARYSNSSGNFVEIDHGDGFVTQYFHMSRYVVKVGQVVESGELLGYVGNTGVSTSAHLHFGMIYNGSYVNPADYVEF